MEDKIYILLQRRIFKKYHAENLALTKIVTFNRMCSEIATEKEYELNYSTVRHIMKIVRNYMKEENNKT